MARSHPPELATVPNERSIQTSRQLEEPVSIRHLTLRQLARADCVHDVTWQPATLPWWMRGFKSPWTLCPVAQRWCGWLLTRRLQVRALPGQPDSEGRANRHDGTRLESGRGESPCRFESCPFRCSTRACSRESSQAPTLTERVRLLPSLLRVSVAEQPRHRPAASDRRVRLPPDTLVAL